MRRDVEAAHQVRAGSFKPYYRIAVDLYDDHPTSEQVRAQIERLYNVRVCKKTASAWINRGLDERRQQLQPEEARVAA